MQVLLKFRRLKRKILNISCVRLRFGVFICMFYKLQSNECMLVTGAVKFQWYKIPVSSPVIILLKKIFVCIGHRDNVLSRCDLIFSLLRCHGGWNKMCTQLSLFQILFSEFEELQSWGCSKILLSFFMWFNGHFWANQQQQQCLPDFELILDSHLSRHLLLAPFPLKIENTT
jgi:hypothetical protein